MTTVAGQVAIIVRLEGRIKELEDLLGLHNDDLAVFFKLPNSLGRLFGLLLSIESVSEDIVQDRLNITTDIKVAVYRLRNHLKDWDIEIRSRRTVGYWIDDATKTRVRELVTPKVTSPSPSTALAA